LKTYEYLACEKPIVASSIPGVKALIEFFGSGISVVPENLKELAVSVVNCNYSAYQNYLIDIDFGIKDKCVTNQ